MSRSGQTLRDAMAALAREELRGAEHPPASRLIAYHRGEVRAVEAAAIREHLSLCAECAALVLDAAEFFADEEEEPAELDEAAWQELRAAASGAEEPSRSPVPPALRAGPRRSRVRSPAFAYGVAAALAAVSIGLFFFRGTTPHPQPEVNPGFHDLRPSGQRGAEVGWAPIRFSSPNGSAFLVLNPAVVPHSVRYGVRIRRADGAVVWQSRDLALQPSGGFHIRLPAGALPLGRYSLELYGITEGREAALGTYRIAIER